MGEVATGRPALGVVQGVRGESDWTASDTALDWEKVAGKDPTSKPHNSTTANHTNYLSQWVNFDSSVFTCPALKSMFYSPQAVWVAINRGVDFLLRGSYRPLGIFVLGE